MRTILVAGALVGSLTLGGCGGDGSTDTSTDDTADDAFDDASDDASDDDGPPPPTGLDGFCDHYIDCGGTYYANADACVDASVDYWGECARPDLDAFGDCMLELSCEEWGDPDAYNPSSTPCAEPYGELGSSC
jgi:hypothetical protein